MLKGAQGASGDGRPAIGASGSGLGVSAPILENELNLRFAENRAALLFAVFAVIVAVALVWAAVFP